MRSAQSSHHRIAHKPVTPFTTPASGSGSIKQNKDAHRATARHHTHSHHAGDAYHDHAAGSNHSRAGVLVDDAECSSIERNCTTRRASNSSLRDGLTDRTDLRIAVCLLGLERTFDVVVNNMALLFARWMRMGTVHVFGVQPVQDSWSHVRRFLQLSGLHLNASIETQTIANFTAPPKYFPQSSGRSFMIELWDCAHCAAMIKSRESRQGWLYDVVARVRLDLFWETFPSMPREFTKLQVHVPAMSSCNGVNDKFAIGDRLGMERYLMRVHRLPYDRQRSSFNSEQMLKSALRGVHIRSHYNWLFCKMGRAGNLSSWSQTSGNMWSECSLRIWHRLRCQRMVCGWCGQGCRCWNSSCSNTDNIVLHKRLCHDWVRTNRTNRNGELVIPGWPVSGQLLLD